MSTATYKSLDQSEINDLLGGLTDEYAECRAFKHAWTRKRDTRKAMKGEAVLQLECTRCTTKRKDTFNINTGGLVARVYDYPEDYSIKGTLTVDDLRRDLARRYHFIGGRK